MRSRASEGVPGEAHPRRPDQRARSSLAGLSIVATGVLGTWVLARVLGPFGRPRKAAYIAGRSAHPLTLGRDRPAERAILTAKAAQRLNHASAVLAASVLFDSGMEHYRGQFFNRAMYTPLAVSSLVLAASLHGAADRSTRSKRMRHIVQALAAGTGIAGLGFHAYNVGKREGGYSWQNLFYAAPIGAPFALVLAGALGVTAERVREADRDEPYLAGLPAGRVVAGGTAAALIGTIGEAGLLHFRGSFHNPFMFLPVSLPPLAALVLTRAALAEPNEQHRLAKLWMILTALIGIGGMGFHTYGVSRRMGGWRNWSQNLIDGPPLPAPPSFTGLALAGLAAIELMEKRALALQLRGPEHSPPISGPPCHPVSEKAQAR